MLDFRPPKDSPALIAFVKLMLPLFMKWDLHDTQIQPVSGAAERFMKYRGKRALVCPNHSNRNDPEAMFAFSKIVHEDFNFVAAREVFEWRHGLNGWWLQHLGTYSVVRGAADRESFKTTKRILVEGSKKLVLFPEGEISRQNDTLLPLESGCAQLTFWALEELHKKMPDEPIYIIPMALKYTFSKDISAQLRRTMTTLEGELKMPQNNGAPLYQRLLALSEKLLSSLEQEYNIHAVKGASMNERIEALRSGILSKLAAYLEVDLPKNGRPLESVRILRNAIDDFIYEDAKEQSDYHKKTREEKERTFKTFYKDLDRVVNFICIYEGYVKDKMSQERFADVLDRLETEIIGGFPSFKGPRVIFMDVAEAIDLRDYAESYKASKKATIAKVTEDVFARMSAMLIKLESERTPVLVS